MVTNESRLEMNRRRSLEFRRSNELEEVLFEVNELIKDIGVPSFPQTRYPVLLIMGCPRSGSTLLLQWFASLGLFSYPSNLIARFYGNPYLGAKIQQILIDYDKNQQINMGFLNNFFSSRLGKTTGAMSPSEYWYFWRRFFKFGEIQKLRKSSLEKVDYNKFISDIAALESVFDKPLVMKGMIMNWHIPYLAGILKEKCLFINMERDPIYTAQSLYLSRIAFFNNPKRWFSYKPPEYRTLKRLSPLKQVAGQVYHTVKTVRSGLREVPRNQIVNIQYEDFCKNPHKYFGLIRKKLYKLGYRLRGGYAGEKSYKINNKVRLKSEEITEIKKYYSKFCVGRV